MSLVVLQFGVTDKWMWKLHFSHRHTIKSAYDLLTTFEVGVDDRFNHVLWLKKIPVKVNIFIWHLFLNRLATKMNMFRRNIMDYNDSLYTATCDMVDDLNHLFFTCAFYRQL